MASLSERETRVLAFERHWWRQPGAKEQAISGQLGLSATRYYQMLNELIGDRLFLGPRLPPPMPLEGENPGLALGQRCHLSHAPPAFATPPPTRIPAPA